MSASLADFAVRAPSSGDPGSVLIDYSGVTVAGAAKDVAAGKDYFWVWE